MPNLEEIFADLPDKNSTQNSLDDIFSGLPDRQTTKANVVPAGNWGSQSYDSALAQDIAGQLQPRSENTGTTLPPDVAASVKAMESNNDGALTRSFKAGFANVFGGVGDYVNANTGNQTAKEVGDWGNRVSEENTRQKEYHPSDMIPFKSDYWTNPEGALYDIGQAAGSSTATLPLTAVIASILPESVPAGVAVGASKILNRLGLTGAAEKAISEKGIDVAKWATSGAIGKTPEAFSEGGNVARQLKDEGYTDDEIRAAANFTAAYNIPVLMAEGAVELTGLTGTLGKFAEKPGAGVLQNIARNAGVNIPTQMVSEGATELKQQQIQNEATGQPHGNFFNPTSWQEDEIMSGLQGSVGALGMGGAGSVVGGIRSNGGFNQNHALTGRGNLEDIFSSLPNKGNTEPQIQQQSQTQPQDFSTQQSDPYAAMAQQVSEKTGIPAELIYGQLYHGSGGFNSSLARENNNFGGLTQVESNGEENKQPDGGNYYMNFRSPEEFANYYADYLKKYAENGILDAKTPEEFAAALKDGGYYTDSVDNYAAGIKSGMENFGASGGTGYRTPGSAKQNNYTETPLPTFTPEEQQQAVTWLEERRDTSDNEKEINDIDKQLTEKKPLEILTEYKVKDENGQEVALGQKLFPEKYQQQQTQAPAQPNAELLPFEQDYIKQVIQQEIKISKDQEWKKYLSGIAKGNAAALTDFANNYSVNGTQLIELAKQATLNQSRQNFNKIQQAVNNAKIGIQNLKNPTVQPFVESGQVGQARDLTTILNAIATQKYDKAEQGLAPIPGRVEPAKSQSVFSPVEAQMRLNQLTGQQPAQIIMPNQTNQADQQAINEIRQSLVPAVNTLPTTEQLMTRRELQRALSRKDYPAAIDLANQLGMTRHAEIYKNLANRAGGIVREHITAENIRRSVAYDKLNDMEKLFVDVLEYFKVSADQVERQIKEEYNGIIKEYEAVLRNQVKQPGIKTTQQNISGDKFSRIYSGNFKWFMDLAKQRGYSANNIPQKVINEAIPQIALEHLKNGYTDPQYGQFVNEEMSQHFNDMEAAINGITSVREKISGAVPAALREPTSGSESDNRSVQAAKQAIPIAKEFGREQPTEQPAEEVKPELTPVQQKQVEGALKSPSLKRIAEKVQQGDGKAKEQFDKLPEHIRKAIAEREKTSSVQVVQDKDEKPVTEQKQTTAVKQPIKPQNEVSTQKEEPKPTVAERSFDVSKEQALKEKLLAKRKPKKNVNVFDDSDAALDQALKDLRGELNNLSANPIFNPKLMEAALRVGGIYAQRGVNNFGDWSAKIVEAVGEKVRPYLPSTWEMLNNFPEGEKYDQEAVNTLFEYAGIQYENGHQKEKDFADRITSELGSEFTPFIKMAYSGISKWKGETQDAKRTGSVVESDSEGQPTTDRMGLEILPHGSNGTSGSDGHGSEAARKSGSKQRSGKRLSDVRSDGSRTESNPGVREEEPGDKERAAGSEQLPRSGNNSIERVSSDQTAATGVVEAATDRQDVAAKLLDQKKVGNKTIEVANLDNIRDTLPFLMPEQQEDVHFIEQRFSISDGYGALITNGTGTGKTYSGLGVVKRFAMQGKDNILIVVPSDKIANDWIKSAKNLDLNISQLESTKDSGKGIVVTTYANYGQNSSLVKRNWDLIVHDESHYLSSNEKGETTGSLKSLRKLTYHKTGLYGRFNDVEQKLVNDVKEAYAAIETARQSGDGRQRQSVNDLEKKHTELARKMEARRDELTSEWKALKSEDKPRVLFLSATPFAYVKNIDYAEGYLFNYADKEGRGYNDTDGYEQFFVEHFGYRMRYNKLTLPDAEVNNSLMEREFHEWLRKQGALSGRVLTVDKDYDRHFVLVDDAIGAKLDEGLKWLNDEGDGRYRPLYDVIMANFKYHNRMYLLESLKAKHAVNLAKDYLDQGKKVVVFHDFNKGGGFHPFLLDAGALSSAEQLITNGSKEATSLKDLYREFKTKRPDLIGMDFSGLKSPIATFKEAFGDAALLFNGTIPKKTRLANVDLFNDDNSGKDLILVQSDAGCEGISLHDRTGEHQRVLINLGMPVKPTAAIQIEGRIYRVGQASDAIFRYLNTGTTFEQHTFASKIAERASTAENLALGEDARALRESFVDAFEESGDYGPGMDNEGKGGKEQDKVKRERLTPFEKAVSYYYGQQKKTSKNKAREGQDYFATPEPIGLKMVEWANLANNEKALEPSAGHGAISRFFNETADNVIIEPSYELAPKAAMVSSAKLISQRFEDYYIGNKFHGVIMNPPYGHGGKTAIEHVAKATKHLYNGGRVVALIPDGGMADKYFNKWYESDDAKGIHMVGEVKLPGITFNRAGTSVRTRLVVLEKQTNPDAAAKINQRSTIDLSGIDDTNELFKRIENISMPEREKGNDSDQEQTTPKEEQDNEAYSLAQFDHTKTGEPIYIAKPNKHLGDMYTDVLQLAKKFKGWYNKFGSKDQKGFAFKSETDRQSFLDEVGTIDTDIKYSSGKNTPPDSVIERALKIRFIPEPKLKSDEQTLSELGSQMGVPVRFFVAPRGLRGFHADGITYVNRNGNRGIEWAFWHESLHWMKQQDPELYQDLYDTVNNTFAVTPEQITAYRDTIEQGQLRGDNGELLLSDDDIIEEMFGDELADVAKRQQWFNQLAQQDKGLFDRFVDFFKKMLANIKAMVVGTGQHSGFSPEQVKVVENSLRRVLLSLKNASGQRVMQDKMEFPYRELQPEAMQFSSGSDDVNQFIGKALQEKKTNNILVLRPVSTQEAINIKHKTGVDVAGYVHALNAFDIRHILNKHGVGNEKQSDQIPLTERDLKRIPDVLNDPENIEKGSTSQQGEPTIRYIKSDKDGTYFVVEVVKKRDKTLSVKTMWKKSIAKNYVSKTADPHHTSTSVFILTPDGDVTSSNESARFQSGGLQLPKEGITKHDSIDSIVQQEKKDVNKGTIKYSAESEASENSVQSATDNLAHTLGLKPAENVTVVGRPVVNEPGFAGRYLQSVKPLAEKHPKLMPFFRLASTAMEKQEKLRNDFRHRLDKIEKLLGDKENKKSLFKILLDGDASQHNYTTQELTDAGYNGNVIRAYHAIRTAYQHAYRLANEIRQGIETKSENMSAAKLAELKNNKFVEILSVAEKGRDQYLVSWKQPKITEHVVTVTKSELEALRQDPNVQIGC